MFRQICLFGLGLALSVSLCSSLEADIIAGNTADSAVITTGAGAQGSGTFGRQNLNAATIRVGRFNGGDGGGNGNGQTAAAVYVFELPDLGAVADPFETANLDFSITTINNNTPYNVDLYGIDRRADSLTLPAADFFVGPSVDPNATLLQDNIITSASRVGRINSGDIASYLNTQYDGGAGAGEFVFLRLNADFTNTNIIDTTNGFLLGTANNGTEALRPVINFTQATVAVVPEPSSLSVLLLGATFVSSRRRRNR